LQEGSPSEAEKVKYAETIQRNGKQLAKLVDDLLDLSKVEAGRLEIEKIDSPIVTLVSEVLSLLQFNAKKKNLQLEVSFAGPVPEFISVDPYRFKQVLTNIAGNAVKFTDEGRVVITLRFLEMSSELFISVRDSGRGISPLEREKLFKPFSQADASMTRKYGGTGLGLNFSRELVRLQGGDIELSWSEIGVGSEFTIRLPVQTPPGTGMLNRYSESVAGELNAPLPAPSYDFRDLSILVVDDSADNRDLIRRFLQPSGAVVDEAKDGIECLEKIASNRYAVVLMDIQMPGLDGLETAALLRKQGLQIPVIAITAHAMKEDRDRCLQAGFNHHIAKPINRLELMDAIHSAVTSGSAGGHASNASVSPAQILQ
jgi:CheY-like chemotaxis protein